MTKPRGSTVLFQETVRQARAIADLRDALNNCARSAHDAGQVASHGHLHPGDFETCRAMICEDARDTLGRDVDSYDTDDD